MAHVILFDIFLPSGCCQELCEMKIIIFSLYVSPYIISQLKITNRMSLSCLELQILPFA